MTAKFVDSEGTVVEQGAGPRRPRSYVADGIGSHPATDVNTARRPFCVLMAGLPGSGKTTLARVLTDRGFVRLCTNEKMYRRHGEVSPPHRAPVVASLVRVGAVGRFHGFGQPAWGEPRRSWPRRRALKGQVHSHSPHGSFRPKPLRRPCQWRAA
ncbi:zeta toxin family protein [Streptomyces viridochromogenes]|uniref:zeta toxin family protein n=1 Tax=Streptomyces viridochromogenes TaxID=1938 RepID=UPI00351E07DE